MFSRTFDTLINEDELKWHFDEKDRTVSVLQNHDWQIQFDNCLPVLLEGVIQIPKNTYHRIIRGTGNLKVLISET